MGSAGTGDAEHVAPSSFHCPFPGCKRKYLELWKLRAHVRAPPRASAGQGGHGSELRSCPKCDRELHPSLPHLGCLSGLAAPRQAVKRRRMATQKDGGRTTRRATSAEPDAVAAAAARQLPAAERAASDPALSPGSPSRPETPVVCSPLRAANPAAPATPSPLGTPQPQMNSALGLLPPAPAADQQTELAAACLRAAAENAAVLASIKQAAAASRQQAAAQAAAAGQAFDAATPARLPIDQLVSAFVRAIFETQDGVAAPRPAAASQHSGGHSMAADGAPPLASPRHPCFRLPSEASVSLSPALAMAPHPAASGPHMPYSANGQRALHSRPATPTMSADPSQQHGGYASPFQAAVARPSSMSDMSGWAPMQYTTDRLPAQSEPLLSLGPQPAAPQPAASQPAPPPGPPPHGQQWVLMPASAPLPAAAMAVTAAMPAAPDAMQPLPLPEPVPVPPPTVGNYSPGDLRPASDANWGWLNAFSSGFPVAANLATGGSGPPGVPMDPAAWQQQQQEAAGPQQQAAARPVSPQPLPPTLSLGNWQQAAPQPVPQLAAHDISAALLSQPLSAPLASRSIGGLDWGDLQFLTTALRSGSINAGTLLRGESLTNENWLQEAEFK